MTTTVLTAGAQIPADPGAPIRLDFELHSLRVALVGRADVNRLTEDWTKPGVYVLLGAISHEHKTELYVGQAIDIRSRLSAHRRTPKLPWWRAVPVIWDNTTGFNSAQIGYLEGRLAQELRARPGVQVREGVSTMDVTLPTFARAPLDAFVATILEALRLAGVDLRSTADEGPEGEQVGSGKGRTTIPGTVKDLLAAGLLSAGSRLTAAREVRGDHRELEAEVSAAGELIFNGVAYRSPSKPAELGFGLKAINGWTAWRTADGKALADLRDELPSAFAKRG